MKQEKKSIISFKKWDNRKHVGYCSGVLEGFDCDCPEKKGGANRCRNIDNVGFECFDDQNIDMENSGRFLNEICPVCKSDVEDIDWDGLSKLPEEDLFQRWWGLEQVSYGKDYKEVGREAFDMARKPLLAKLMKVRVLIEKIQWARVDNENKYSGFCPACRKMEVNRNDNAVGHKDDCAVKLILEMLS